MDKVIINRRGEKHRIIFDKGDLEIIESFHLRVSCKSGCLYAQGHKKGESSKKVQALHRVLMNAKPGEVVDHKNGNTLDNRRSNLRVCRQAQNLQNKSKFKRKCSSAYKGVDWVKKDKRWRARVYKDGKQVFGSYFDNELDAAKAYNKNAKRFFGEFARINDI